MRSIVAVTGEMDDAEKAVRELLEQINSRGPLCKNSCAFVFCDVEIAHEAFMESLKEKLPFDVVGCTTIATLDGMNGSRILSAVLVVMTGDDVRFSVALTDELTPENLSRELRTAYGKAEAAVGGPQEAKLIFLYPPFGDDSVPLDDYVDILSDASGDIPVFGGLPSSSIADGDILMYANGRTFTNRAAVVLLGGNVRPVFSVQNVLSALSEQKSVVTKAEKNIIHTVENSTFVDHLRQIGLPVDDLISQGDLAVYVSTPLKVNLNKNDNNDGIPVVRTIKSLDPVSGSGVLFGSVPENSTISIATMKRQDIQDSCRQAIQEILQKIDDSQTGDYTWTTLLCVSCGGRYMVMADDKDIEGNILKENLPASLNLAGFYAYGEICPTAVHDGKALNRVHNESIVICAL